MDYLAPFETIKAMVEIATARGEVTINTSYDDFLKMIRALIANIDVDEAWYVQQYPDVAEAISAGNVPSARHHFLSDGYFEGRLPFAIKVDERWYLTQNPGVAEYIRAGRLTSGQQHFDYDGYREGRQPFPL